MAQGKKVILTSAGEFELSPITMHTTWNERIMQLSFAKAWELNINWAGSTTQLLEAIVLSTVLAVSNGSYQHEKGACVWIIEGHNSLD